MIEIRRAIADDVDALLAVEADADQRYADSAHPELADGGTIPRDAAARAADNGQIIVAVDEDDAVVGWLLLTLSGDEWCIGQISVRRDAGGRGIGTRLLQQIIAAARAAGRPSIVLNTQADVAWNRPWYERHGFEVIAQSEWTEDMHVITTEQTADGLDWATRVHMRLMF